jgi:predicted DNA-binding WGR domain protein
MNRRPLISNHRQTHDRHAVPPWHGTIAFARIEPENYGYRGYHLELAQDLFGKWTLVRSWGRIGRSPRTQIEYFVFRFDAKEHAPRIVR